MWLILRNQSFRKFTSHSQKRWPICPFGKSTDSISTSTPVFLLVLMRSSAVATVVLALLILGLDQNIDALAGDWTSYTVNTLDVNDVLNIATNGDLAGSQFSALGGTTNIQRQHTTSIGGEFVHIELEQSFRIDGGESVRSLISQIIANSIIAAVTAVPEPSPIVIEGVFGVCFLTRRRRIG